MGLYLGNSTGSYYVGSNPVAGIYMGDTAVWYPGVTDALFFYIDAYLGATPVDLSLNSGTGSLNNGAGYTTLDGVPTWSFLQFASSLDFTHTDSMNVDMTETNFGASFWAKKGNSATNVELLTKGSNYGIEFGGSTTISNMEAQAQSSAGTGSTIFASLQSAGSLTEWYHYVYSIVYTGTQYVFTLYRDGVFQSSTSYSATTYNNFGTVTNTGGMKLSNGRCDYIAYVKLFKKSLSADEALLEYNSTKDRFVTVA